jgi:hypothetical protein
VRLSCGRPLLRKRTEASPFAKAFFMLVEALGIVEL